MFSSNSSQVADDKLFSEDVFSSYLYTGNSSTQTITNGIDLAGKGGLVWVKQRNSAQSHRLYDTSRGVSQMIASNTTSAQANTSGYGVTNFGSSGFTLVDDASNYGVNVSGNTYVSWTFRKAPKFFDVVTYTGNGASRTISHSLGVAPGFIIIKRTDASQNWFVWHRFNGTSPKTGGALNLTNAISDTSNINQFTATTFNPDWITDTTFLNTPNVNGATYVAYLFAHDTTSDGIIQCGSFTGDGTGSSAANALGWEPQALLIKRIDSTGDWQFFDSMRGFSVGTPATNLPAQVLYPNLASAEVSVTNQFGPTAKGFLDAGYGAPYQAVYIAIRRGPMRTPTSGTSVFSPASQVGGGTITTNFPSDMTFGKSTGITEQWYLFDRLRGSRTNSSVYLSTNNTNSETTSSGYGLGYDSMTTVRDNFFGLAYNYSFLNFRRAPSFFDEVCYTGTGSATTQAHNLGVVPELMIVKQRNISTQNWGIYHKDVGNTKGLFFDTATPTTNSGFWNNTTPTASVFSLGNFGVTNGGGGYTYVAYLFASCPGVSKVGSYTGNGSSQTINCGFAAGARFVMIKRTDSTGSWWVWDVARGLVSGNDPALQLNSAAAETTGIDSIDPDSSGFIVNQDATTNINVNAGTYIYMAVA